jgi:hypothetical protein
MEAYDNRVESKLYNAVAQTRSWITTFLGVIVTIVGVAVVFLISSLEGTREIVASNSDNVKILNIWREENNSLEFPEERADIIVFNEQEYYFVLNDGEWYFAYNGGLGYVFRDFKFYVLTAITFAIAMFVANINYISTIKTMRSSDIFVKTLSHYQKVKERIEKHTQYIPEFCTYKNQQAFEIAKRDIIELSGITYDYYNSENFDPRKLQDWQRKKLEEIKKIKVKKIQSSDLLQEHGYTNRNIQLLPMSQEEHKKEYNKHSAIQKFISSFLSGTVVAFGIVLGNWVLGITYGMVVITSYVSSIVVASDFVTSTLRNRYIAKADLLNEFDNIKHRFIDKNEPKQLPQQESNNTPVVI